jgi:hypothetical protein
MTVPLFAAHKPETSVVDPDCSARLTGERKCAFAFGHGTDGRRFVRRGVDVKQLA